MKLNSAHTTTLNEIFRDPILTNIVWAEVEALFVGVGCKVIEGAGSRVRFEWNGLVASFHRPHPQKESRRYQVKDARDYLTRIGVVP